MNNLVTFYIFEIEYALVGLQINRYFRLLLFDVTLIKSSYNYQTSMLSNK